MVILGFCGGRSILKSRRVSGMPMEEVAQGKSGNPSTRNGTSGNPLKDMIKDLDIEWIGNIPYDPQIEAFDFQGKPLIDLPAESRAFRSVEKIMGGLGI